MSDTTLQEIRNTLAALVVGGDEIVENGNLNTLQQIRELLGQLKIDQDGSTDAAVAKRLSTLETAVIDNDLQGQIDAIETDLDENYLNQEQIADIVENYDTIKDTI